MEVLTSEMINTLLDAKDNTLSNSEDNTLLDAKDNTLLDIFKKYPHYSVFPIIYSVKDILKKYCNDSDDLCELCFMYPVDWSDDTGSDDTGSDDTENSININMNMQVVNNIAKTKHDTQLLCSKCKYIYNERDVLELVQEILNESYHHEGNERFNELIKIFGKFVSNPYEKLLVRYFSYDITNYYTYHKQCKHYTGTSNDPDNTNILCPYILDIIEHITNLYFTDFLAKCPIQYMEILIKKGIDINYIFTDQTVFGSLLYSYFDNFSKKSIYSRVNKLVSLGADVNHGNPIRYITGIQYEDRPNKIEKIKYLLKIGVKFDNKCIYKCVDACSITFGSAESCSRKSEARPSITFGSAESCSHKMLYDTRLGKLIQKLG
jgi:hypothetical protein